MKPASSTARATELGTPCHLTHTHSLKQLQQQRRCPQTAACKQQQQLRPTWVSLRCSRATTLRQCSSLYATASPVSRLRPNRLYSTPANKGVWTSEGTSICWCQWVRQAAPSAGQVMAAAEHTHPCCSTQEQQHSAAAQSTTVCPHYAAPAPAPAPALACMLTQATGSSVNYCLRKQITCRTNQPTHPTHPWTLGFCIMLAIQVITPTHLG